MEDAGLAMRSPVEEKFTLFDIDGAVRFVLSTDHNKYDRAIKIYELMVAIHLCQGDGEASGFKVKVRSRDLRDARHFAIIRLMEHVLTKSPFVARFPKLPAISAALTEHYRYLYDNAFFKNGGWRQVRFMPTAREFQRKIDEAHFEYIGQLIDFSIRVVPNPLKPHQSGGITMARDIVLRATESGSREFSIPEKRTKLIQRWRLASPVAIFSYLIYIQRLGWWPQPRLTVVSFPNNLLSASQRQEKLRNLFLRYNEVCDRLTERGYAVQKLTVDGIPTGHELAISPLPVQVQQLVDDYSGPE
jgi:hypothetical protein